MGRPAKGSVRWNARANCWEVRVSLASGKRTPPVPLVDFNLKPCTAEPAFATGCACAACVEARGVAERYSARTRKNGAVPVGTALTSNEWHTGYLKVHGDLGNHIEQHANDWRRYVADIIGTVPMTSIAPAHIKAIRDSLTKLRLAGKISAKRALNVWSDQIKAPFSRAWSDDDPKYSSVRIGPFASNPALGIKPPSSKADQEEDERERQALDPAEALALLSCEALALSSRRLYVVAAYTGLRPAELYGLVWSDVRLDEQVPIIKVQRGRHARTLEEKSAKNRQSVRDVPIHPELRPLLRAMRDEASNPKGHVIPVVNAWEIGHAAGQLRADLLTSGVKRDELQHGTAHLKPFDVRSLRTTFATWCSKAGYDSTWVSRWLGHKPKGTAEKHYVKSVPSFEDVNLRPVQPGTVGPFPPVPESLLGFGGVLVREAKMNGKRPSKRRFAWVLKPSPQSPAPLTLDAREADKRDSVAIGDSPAHSTVLVGESTPIPVLADPDEALKAAIKAAVDAGDFGRASALIEVLRAAPKAAPVLVLAPGGKR